MIGFLILGAGSAIPTPTHSAAAYWVQVDGKAFLMDPGPGALIRLIRAEDGPESLDEIDTVLFTHLHVDHCADLVPLLFAMHSPILRSRRNLHLIGPPGLIAYLERLRQVYGSWLDPARRKLVVQELRPGQGIFPSRGDEPEWTIRGSAPGAVVEAFRAHHPQDRFSEACLILRFCDARGHRAVFSGDTEPSAGLKEASREVDLLVVECSTPDELATSGHMTPSLVGGLCAATRPRRVVLTHLYPPAAALDLPELVGRHFEGSVSVAWDGMYLTVPAELDPAGMPDRG